MVVRGILKHIVQLEASTEYSDLIVDIFPDDLTGPELRRLADEIELAPLERQAAYSSLLAHAQRKRQPARGGTAPSPERVTGHSLRGRAGWLSLPPLKREGRAPMAHLLRSCAAGRRSALSSEASRAAEEHKKLDIFARFSDASTSLRQFARNVSVRRSGR
jgi:hypothetical protein